MALNVSTTPTLKVLVVGDAGVGKTVFCHSLCGTAFGLNTTTVGANIHVLVHEEENNGPVFISLWDVGGSNSYAAGRDVFYGDIDGIILVCDVTSAGTCERLKAWAREAQKLGSDEYADVEATAGSFQLPMLVVATHQDQTGAGPVQAPHITLAKELGADAMLLDARNADTFNLADSPIKRKMARFFSDVYSGSLRKQPVRHGSSSSSSTYSSVHRTQGRQRFAFG